MLGAPHFSLADRLPLTNSSGSPFMSSRELTRNIYMAATRTFSGARDGGLGFHRPSPLWHTPALPCRAISTSSYSSISSGRGVGASSRSSSPMEFAKLKREEQEQQKKNNLPGLPCKMQSAVKNERLFYRASQQLSNGGDAFLHEPNGSAILATPPPPPPPPPPNFSPFPPSPPLASNLLHTSAAAPLAAQVAADEEGTQEFSAEVSDEVVADIYKNEPPLDVHVVNSIESARKAAELLLSPDLANRVFACDTEVMDIEVTKHSPCCHGRVTCFSVYCGPDVDFGDSPLPEGAPKRSMLWVDTYLDGDEAKADEVAAIVDAFRPFFAAANLAKVWHNYSFDRHVMERLGVEMKGFGGDTMHMARLWDSSRVGSKGGYSLEALSSEPLLMGDAAAGEVRGKISMKKLFGRRNVKKDGTEGKLTVLPSVHELQVSEDTRWQWVNYSAYDAKSTYDLYRALERELKTIDVEENVDAYVQKAYERSDVKIRTLWEVYCEVWRPFGELLTDLEAAGVAVDRSHLAEAEQRAVADEEEAKRRFRSWATSKVADAAYMNVGSGSQVLQLLFGGVEKKKRGEFVPLSRVFKVPNQLPPEDGKKTKKTMDITLHSVWGADQASQLTPEVFTPSGTPACSTIVLKGLAGKPGRAQKALAELSAADVEPSGVEVLREDFEEWSTDDAKIREVQRERQNGLKERKTDRELAEELSAEAAAAGYGKLYSCFGDRRLGLEACSAVDALVNASAIDTLLSNFIVPLQSDDISKPDASGVYRVHCSLNINTETGRLSARRPNLQNQPALEKDRYKVRKAFTADRSAGKTLIVADYGQLELRILAHMANCTSMLEAFRLGGDFHSRTALGMYDYIQDAVKAGTCRLESDGGADGVDVPLLKDVFGAERRKAKVLNFSIAYGKTAHGLSKDWGVTLKEAKDTVARWYDDRKEVEAWQVQQHSLAKEKGYVNTILGRRRQLPEATSKNKAVEAHALRAAINTPIQGSAADVATAAMLRIHAHPRLKELGWRLLLQVHDEVILEGPKDSAAEAQAIVVECMRSPFGSSGGDPLRVELSVDSKFAETWYDAK